MTAPVLPPPTEDSHDEMFGELVPPPTAGRYSPPQGGLDLAYRIWATLTWSRILQVVVLLLAIAAGLGTVLHVVTGTAELWTALVGATGAGASVGFGAHAVRNRTARRRAPAEDRQDDRL